MTMHRGLGALATSGLLLAVTALTAGCISGSDGAQADPSTVPVFIENKQGAPVDVTITLDPVGTGASVSRSYTVEPGARVEVDAFDVTPGEYWLHAETPDLEGRVKNAYDADTARIDVSILNDGIAFGPVTE